MSSSPSKSNEPAPKASKKGASASDPLRPSDYVDASNVDDAPEVVAPALGFVGWLRWGWRTLTSMRTALVLLLVLAIAAIPGSIFPQRSADPNGVLKWESDNPDLFPVLDWFQLFDVYGSVWFSAIYLLLFASLVGCIIPRIKHHAKALRALPPRTPARLSRLSDHRSDEFEVPGEASAEAERAVALAAEQLKSGGYRVHRYDSRGSFSVSAERGYARETGNLVFHISLVGVLISVGIGGGIAYTGQTVIVEGNTFVNQLVDYTQMNKGRFVGDDALSPYAMRLDSFDVTYQAADSSAPGQAGNFAANITLTDPDGTTDEHSIRVNHPLNAHGDRIYLLGNGYAPKLTVRNADGDVVFTGQVPFLAQDNNMTSLGVVKITDGMPEQLGLLGFFYPTAAKLDSGAYTSAYPDLNNPILTLETYEGDLGINDGTPRNVYTLDTDSLTKIGGRETDNATIELMPGMTADLPNGLGTITFDNVDPDAPRAPSTAQVTDYKASVARFVSLQMHSDPSATFVLIFAVLATLGLLLALFIPRRRIWVKAIVTGDNVTLEYAGLARGEDPQLAAAVDAFAEKHQASLAETKVG